MNRRFMGFKNMADAQNWYVNHILSSNKQKSDRIVDSTKLSDLIYSSYAFEDLFYNNKFEIGMDVWFVIRFH